MTPPFNSPDSEYTIFISAGIYAVIFTAIYVSAYFVRKQIGVYKKKIADLEKIAENSRIEMSRMEAEKGRAFAILESMVEGVLVVNPEQKILAVNSALVRDFELESRPVEGRYFWELFRDADVNQLIQTCLLGQAAIQKEHKVLLTGLTFEIQASPVFRGSEFLGAAIIFHNVTRLKNLESLRSEFVANVSHELKTPLTSILGFVETLKEVGPEDTEHRNQFLDIIEGHAKKLHRLIEDLLLLSKVESGFEAMNKEKTSLPKLLENITQLLSAPIKEKSVTLSLDITPKEFFLNVQPTLFSQAVFNLIENAVKYNKPGGKVSVRGVYELNEVQIEVSDTGIGISEADLPRVFERFYRADKSRSRETGGAGLGLAISKHIIERHGGRIELRSALSEGSVFTLILPGARI